jgi:hypothetical protein
MKKVIVFLWIIIGTVITTHAQPNHPTRYEIDLAIGSKVEQATKTEIAKYYPHGVSETAIVVKVTDKISNRLHVFIANKEEFEFLKKQVPNCNTKILLDDEYFVGYIKMLIY